MEITRNNFHQALKAAVLEKGTDYVYPTELKVNNGTIKQCVYTTPEGLPLCLIGYALFKLGIVVPHNMFKNAMAVLTGYGVTDSLLLNAAYEAQFIQDSGGSWGEALKEFEMVING